MATRTAILRTAITCPTRIITRRIQATTGRMRAITVRIRATTAAPTSTAASGGTVGLGSGGGERTAKGLTDEFGHDPDETAHNERPTLCTHTDSDSGGRENQGERQFFQNCRSCHGSPCRLCRGSGIPALDSEGPDAPRAGDGGRDDVWPVG